MPVRMSDQILRFMPYAGLIVAIIIAAIGFIVQWQAVDERIRLLDEQIKAHVSGYDHYPWFLGADTLHPGLSRAIEKTADRVMHEHFAELIKPSMERIEADSRERWKRFFMANEAKGLIRTEP